MPSTIAELKISDEPAVWAALGFAVEGDLCVVGTVRIRLAGRAAGHGIVGWALREVSNVELDGLPTTLSDEPGRADGPVHPNGVTSLDHIVAITPAVERTVAALQGAGLDLRRIREEPTPVGAPRQAFFRLGPVILEVVQAPEEAIATGGGPDRPAFFWGLAFRVEDIDATVARLGAHVSGPRPAVQPGRRIATLRRSAGLGVPVALMTPPGSAASPA